MPVHLFVVHFPIALVVSAAVTELAGLALARPGVRRAAGLLLVAGAVAAFLSFFTGGGALTALQAAGMQSPAAEAHSQWGGAGVWGVCGAGVLRLLWRERLDGPYGWANLAVALAAAALVVAITASGLAIRHGA